jgi:hypothetical protein
MTTTRILASILAVDVFGYPNGEVAAKSSRLRWSERAAALLDTCAQTA